MSRVIKTIEIEGQPVKALFDTGAFHSYVLRKYVTAPNAGRRKTL